MEQPILGTVVGAVIALIIWSMYLGNRVNKLRQLINKESDILWNRISETNYVNQNINDQILGLNSKVEDHYKHLMTRITEISEPKKESNFADTGWWIAKIVNQDFLIWVDKDMYHHIYNNHWCDIKSNQVELIAHITDQPEIIHDV